MTPKHLSRNVYLGKLDNTQRNGFVQPAGPFRSVPISLVMAIMLSLGFASHEAPLKAQTSEAR